MGGLIAFLIAVLIFAVVTYGVYWVCTYFHMPQFVFWIAGTLLLVILILYLAQWLGVSTTHVPAPR